MKVLASALFILALTAPAFGASPESAAAPAPKADPWAGWRFLIGDWVGEGGGGPGQGSGTFSFQPDLQEKVVVRRNHSEYPATKDRPAAVHDDLMIVYPGPDARHAKAAYWDSEGHEIRYAAESSEDGKSFTFLSDGSSPGPRFRLTYTREADDKVGIKFEIAPPDKPDAFSTYITASAHRSARN
jgi:hypothetical protein